MASVSVSGWTVLTIGRMALEVLSLSIFSKVKFGNTMLYSSPYDSTEIESILYLTFFYLAISYFVFLYCYYTEVNTYP